MSYKEARCPFCIFSTKQNKKLYAHLESVHNITDFEQCYINTVLKGAERTCDCSLECTARLKWSGWKHGYSKKSPAYVRGHNARIDSIYFDKEFQEKVAKKRKGSIPWNKGLSKESDDRIAKTSKKISETLNEGYSSGRLTDWRINNPEKAKTQAQKMSVTKKEKAAKGELNIWNKGLTKSVDIRILSAANKISETYVKREAGRRLNSKEVLERVTSLENFELLSKIDDYRSKYHTHLSFRCKKCGNIIRKTLGSIENTPICKICFPYNFASKPQIELYEFVKSLESSAVLSDRELIFPYETDVLIPTKLAIEFDGLYWHSEIFDQKNRQAKKKAAYDKKNIKSIFIFEDEWRDKKDIVKSIIEHKLGKSKERIFARKTNIVELNRITRRKFFDLNHIDGDVISKISFGLEDERKKIVSAISLRSPFHKKAFFNSIEIARFATINHASVPGGLSRLVKHASLWSKKQGYKKLITYADRKMGNGEGYKKIGFSHVRTIAESFWWTDFERRFNRFAYKANKEKGLTESQVAEISGVYKIWGCGNELFEMNL